MWVNSYWLSFSNSYLCARTKWWLIPSPKACHPRLSSGTARSWLVMLFSPLVYYVASAANFERWLWALRFSLFFLLDCLYFFLAFYVASGGFELRLIDYSPLLCWYFFRFFIILYFFLGAQYCLFKIPPMCMGESDKAPTNKICRRASSKQRPRTKSCHESERLV